MEQVSLEVILKTKADKSGLEKLKSDATRAAGQIGSAFKNVTALMPRSMRSVMDSVTKAQESYKKIKTTVPKLFGQGGEKDQEKGGGMLGKMAGGIGSMVGLLAGLTIIGAGMFKGIEMVVERLTQASPMLKGTLKMLDMGFNMILRPIGDVLAMLLRPVANFFRAIGKQVMEWMKKRRAELIGQGKTPQEAAATIFSEMPQKYLDVVFEAVSRLDWGAIIANILAPIALTIGQFMNPIAAIIKNWDKICTDFTNALEGLGKTVGQIWANLITAVMWTVDRLKGFGQYVYDLITGKVTIGQALMDIGKWFYDLFVGVYNGFAGYINKMFGWMGINIQMMQTSAQLAQAAADKKYWENYAKIGEVGTNNGHSVAYRDTNITKAAGGAEMVNDGIVYAHKGETIKDTGQIQRYIIDAVRSVGSADSGPKTIQLVLPGAALADAIDRRADVRIALDYRNNIRRRGI